MILQFQDRPSNSNEDYIKEFTTVFGNSVNGYHDQPDFLVVGGHFMDDTYIPLEVRNAYFQKGSLQNIFN